MAASENASGFSAIRKSVGDAGGVEKSHWFVAIVNNNTEKASSERLEKQGYDCFVATQTEMRVWKNGRRAKVERVVIPSTLFVRCTERERRIIVTYPFINRFMTNKAGAASGVARAPLAVIPDAQIETLRFMLGHSDTPVVVSGHYSRGDRVRVVRGSLQGLEGEVIETGEGKGELVVQIDIFGCARLTIDLVNVEPVR